MNKLGLRITNNGREAYVANPNQDWELHTVDFNACLLALEGIDEGDDVVILSHDAGGCYVGIVKLLKMGFNGVCVAGSVFVPVDLSVDGKTVLNYVDEVRRQLSSAVLDGAKLDRLFAAEFPQKDFVPPFVPSSGEGFASRIVDFNGEELEQLLDSLYLFQSAYSHYKAILIVDKNSGIKVNATDITDEPLIMPEPEPELEPEPDLKVVVVEDSEPQEEGELADEATYSESDSSEGVEVIVVDKPDSDEPIVNIEEEGLNGADIEIVEDEEGRPENLVAEVEGSVPNGLETELDEAGLEEDTDSSVVEVVDLPESESRGEARISYSRSLPTPPPPPDALPDPSDAMPTPPAADMPAPPAVAVPVEPTSLSGNDNDSLPTDDGVEFVDDAETTNVESHHSKANQKNGLIIGGLVAIVILLACAVFWAYSDNKEKEEAEMWNEIEYSHDLSEIRRFLEEFPDGMHADMARDRLDYVLEEGARWNDVKDRGDTTLLQEFMSQYSDGPYYDKAVIALEDLRAQHYNKLHDYAMLQGLMSEMANKFNSNGCEYLINNYATHRLRSKYRSYSNIDEVWNGEYYDYYALYLLEVGYSDGTTALEGNSVTDISGSSCKMHFTMYYDGPNGRERYGSATFTMVLEGEKWHIDDIRDSDHSSSFMNNPDEYRGYIP
ncbi:MAG: hypothetical protein II677_01670 [Muribaculaceae bacterium]|nr:hypothetical protein [Muribaculaceae bacterium]